MNFRLLAFAVLTWFAFLPQASAHQVDSVELEFLSAENSWQLKGLLDIAYMLPESRGVEEAPPLFRKDVMAAPKAEHDRLITVAESTMRKLLTLKFNGKPLDWKISFPNFEKEPLVLPEEVGGWALMQAVIDVKPQSESGTFEVHWNDNLNSELILIILEDDDVKDLLSVSSGMSVPLLTVKASKQNDKPVTTLPSSSTRAESWIISGFRHVIPLGLDHVLFILGLFLLAPRWKPLLGQSLLFTLAHSITLALAIFGIINLPSRLVEILIAASIAWIGIENLILKDLKPSRLYFVFGFGLLHGIGFAGALKEKLGNLSGNELALPLISFNVGVELAQITLLTVAFILLIPFRKSTKLIQKIGSLIVAIAGLCWMFERIFL